jgi:hypothetical protein
MLHEASGDGRGRQSILDTLLDYVDVNETLYV